MINQNLNPIVSIVLPVHNGEKYLRLAIESCLTQTFQDFELILVDDKSSDGSFETMKEYAEKDTRIKIIRNYENKKLPASLNIGFNEAIGQFYTWTSDDNILQNDFLELMIQEIKRTGADIVYSDYIAIDENGNEIEICRVGKPNEFPLPGSIGASFIYRKKVHESLNGFDTSLFLIEDYDFWVRSYLKGFRYSYINATPYKYRRHSTSLTESAKKKINKKIADYRFELRDKIKLNKSESVAMKVQLIRQNWKGLTFSQTSTLIYEILTNEPKQILTLVSLGTIALFKKYFSFVK